MVAAVGVIGGGVGQVIQLKPVFDFLYKVLQKRGTGNSAKGGYHDEEQDPEGDG